MVGPVVKGVGKDRLVDERASLIGIKTKKVSITNHSQPEINMKMKQSTPQRPHEE